MPMKMRTHALGKKGPQVPALGLGLMGLSCKILHTLSMLGLEQKLTNYQAFYGVPTPDEERFHFLDRAYELGCVHWDSAALYGDSEELLGRWFQKTGKREEIFLATKFGNHVTSDGGREIRNDREYIHAAVAKSLSTLQTEYIDLLYWHVMSSLKSAHKNCFTDALLSHRFSGKTPVEEIVATMKEYVDCGKVKYLGLSECGQDTLRRACKIHQIQAYQIEYSPFSMDIEKPETGLLDTCRELEIATIAYSPLGRGMLTGQYQSINDFDNDDFRRSIPRFSKENFPKNLQLVHSLKTIADKKGCTSGQLSLAWLINQGNDIFPIPGTKQIKYLEENMGALNVKLTGEEDREIRQAIERAEVYGTRVAETLMGGLVMDTPSV
ncbi:MAG: hypothetical protein Q9167_003524 [Letrouitia subvulpina]